MSQKVSSPELETLVGSGSTSYPDTWLPWLNTLVNMHALFPAWLSEISF